MKKERHPVDDVFREVLREHKTVPSEAARNRFLNEAGKILPAKKRRGIWPFYLSGILILIAIGPGSYFLLTDREESVLPSYPASASHDAETETASVANSVLTDPIPLFSSSAAIAPIPGNQKNIDPVSSESEILPQKNDQSGTDKFSSLKEGKSAEDTASVVEIQQAPTVPDSNSIINEYAIAYQDSIVTSRQKKPAGSKKFSSGLSVSYSPEWMFNTLEGTKYVNNFGADLTLSFDRFFVRTGIGISVSKGTNELLVEYNDYLGSYQNLDSITFLWDSKHYYLLPTYHLTEKDVWDSLISLDYPTIIKRYTYLQIPLILGYDVIRIRSVSLGFRAGPILSILISSKQLTEDYDPGENLVIRINQITPDRVQTNWQVMGGINATFRMSERVFVEIEPNIRYYFNSVYEQSEITKKPWSAGLRAAFMVRF